MNKPLLKIKKLFTYSVAAFVFAVTLNLASAYTETHQQLGTINFVGAIVHPPCMKKIGHKQIILNCLNDKLETVTDKININNVAHIKNWEVINDGRNEYFYHWINEEKQLGVLIVRYI